MNRRRANSAASGAVALCLANVLWGAAGPATAQSLTVEQIGNANTIQIEQSAAFDSQIGLLSEPLLSELPMTSQGIPIPLLQQGQANSAQVLVRGVRGAVPMLLQDNASATLDALGITGPLQGNSATVLITGADSTGSVVQEGDGNDAILRVGGAETRGLIHQIGSGNLADLTVDGIGTSVSYTQIGSGLQPLSSNPLLPQAGPTVISNGASVFITQSSGIGPFTATPTAVPGGN